MLSHSVSHLLNIRKVSVQALYPEVPQMKQLQTNFACHQKQHIEFYFKENSLARLTSFQGYNFILCNRYLWQILLNALENLRI